LSTLLLSLHFNAPNAHNARGVEMLVDRKPGNTNHTAEVAYARLIQKAVFNAIKAHDELCLFIQKRTHKLVCLFIHAWFMQLSLNK
jgi:N-acetylmuramoyl-L-alanine amidase